MQFNLTRRLNLKGKAEQSWEEQCCVPWDCERLMHLVNFIQCGYNSFYLRVINRIQCNSSNVSLSFSIFIRLCVGGRLVRCGSKPAPLFVCVNMFLISWGLLKCSTYTELLCLLPCVRLFVSTVHLLFQWLDWLLSRVQGPGSVSSHHIITIGLHPDCLCCAFIVG